MQGFTESEVEEIALAWLAAKGKLPHSLTPP